MQQYRIEIRQAWWFKTYLFALAVTCAVTGRRPDYAKFEQMVCRAHAFKVVRDVAVLEA